MIITISCFQVVYKHYCNQPSFNRNTTQLLSYQNVLMVLVQCQQVAELGIIGIYKTEHKKKTSENYQRFASKSFRFPPSTSSSSLNSNIAHFYLDLLNIKFFCRRYYFFFQNSWRNKISIWVIVWYFSWTQHLFTCFRKKSSRKKNCGFPRSTRRHSSFQSS